MSDGEPTLVNDRYEIGTLIGRGGMADVFVARDVLLDRRVAIKVLFPEFATDPAFVERFRREAQAAANLNHPNIVSVYDWGRSGATYFMAMEYVEGRTLADLVRVNGQLSAEQATDIASEVAAALGFAHRNGVVHRDIKPANILIGANGQVKVADFGIARALDSTVESGLTQAGSVMGTATYFSPEQAQGGQPDPRSDLYSLGIVLYEMVAGRPPFTGDNPVSVAYKQVHDAPQPLNQLAPSVPRPFEAIVAKLLAKNPRVRYATAEAVRDDLRRFRSGQQVLALTELLGASAAAVGAANAPTIAQPSVAPGGEPTVAVPTAPAPTMAQPRTQVVTSMPGYGDDGGYEPQGPRWWIIAASVLAVIALVAGGILLYRALSTADGPDSDTIVLRNLVGRSFDDVVAYLQDEGLEYEAIPEANDTVAENEVWDQDPPAGTELKVGDSVSFKFNPPAAVTLVPDLRGKTRDEAETLLAAEGLTVGEVTTAVDEEIPEGQVIQSVPAAGQEIVAGAPVDLVVSEGSGTVAIPNVITQRADAALNLLQNEPYRFIVDVQTVDDADVPEGDVVSTDPPVGTEVEVGSNITLFVSRGPAQQAVPGVEGFAESDAVELLEAAGFQVDIIDVNVPAGDSNDGVVISQTPGEGVSADPGSTVVLRVGRAVAPPSTTASPTTDAPPTT